MADNKAKKALKEAELNSEIKFKVYYSGDTPANCGVVEWCYNLEPLDKKHLPWLIKCYTNDGGCIQFSDNTRLYQSISEQISPILDIAFVNAKQREAMINTIDKILFDTLMRDNAHENDAVI